MRPRGIGVGLKIAHMRHGRIEVDELGAAQRHRPVRIVALLPVKRHCPSLIAGRCPSLGEPQQWLPVASVHDELDPLAIGDRSVRKAIWLDEYAMARSFAVESETAALMSDLDEPAVKGQIDGCAYRFRLEQQWFG